MGVCCPHCEGIVETEHIVPFTFPDTFYYFDPNKTCKLTNEETQNYVDTIKRKIQQECKVGEFAFTGSGDTMVFGFKFEDEDVIYVAKNYWSDSVAR